MNKNLSKLLSVGVVVGALFASTSAQASCQDVTRAQFEAAAKTALLETAAYGFGLPMWATMVNENGKVCHVYSTKGAAVDNTGVTANNNAWLASRVISAQKANTATILGLDGLSLPTGSVYAAVQPGGSLYGLQASNPVDAAAAYSFKSADGTAVRTVADFGKSTDPLTGKFIGGVNVFGGGLALYNGAGVKVGGIGASGDSSCRDHVFAWRMRVALALDNTPNNDALLFVTGAPNALFQSPECAVSPATTTLMTTTDLTYGIQ